MEKRSDMKESKTTPKNFLLIKAIHAGDIPVAVTGEHDKLLVEVKAGNLVRRTKRLNSTNASLLWNESIPLTALEASTTISFSLYRYRTMRSNQLLGHCEVKLQDFVNNKKEVTINLNFTTGQSGSLVIHYESDIHIAMEAVLPVSTAIENLNQQALVDGASMTQNVVLQIQAKAATFTPILQSVEQFKGIFDELAKIHPFASAAWGLLNLAYTAIKNQNDKDQGIVALYHTMMGTYMAASEKDILDRYSEFEAIFDAMLRQTMECAVFISEYASKTYLRRFITRNVPGKVNDFHRVFADLEKQFHDRMVRTTTTISLGTYSSTKFIEMKVTLAALNPFPSLPSRPSCLVGTRQEITKDILCWIAKCEPGILWIQGVAGSGKSALAGTIAEHARAMGSKHGRLGAFIQFNRNHEPSRFITTLAWKLANFDDRIGRAITEVVRNCSDINERSLSEQFKMLLIETLVSIEDLGSEGLIVVVVDGLDECGVPGKRSDLLDVLAQGFGKRLPMMRLIIMSRPEEDIQHSFDPKRKRHITALPLAPGSWSSRRDVQLYFEEKCQEIRNDEFQLIWRQKNAGDRLTERANGLFIWAATVLEFIKEYPVSRLQEILAAGESSTAEGDLDILYKIALASAVGTRGQDIKIDMILLLGTIIVAKRPLSLTALDMLTFGYGMSKSATIIEKLGSVASIETDKTVGLLHKSFADFLTNQKRSEDGWYIDLEGAQKAIAVRCLARLVEYFTPTPYREIPGDTEPGMPSDISYATEFWIEHVSSLQTADRQIDNRLRKFLETSFLKWLGAVPALTAVNTLKQLLKWTNSVQCGEKDRKLRYHAYQFAERFAADIAEDPSLIYTTALIFTPHNNAIREIYSRSQSPRVIGNGTDRLLVLCEHDHFVHAVAISPDGSKVASGSTDKIMLWDAATGKLLFEPLKGHHGIVWSVAFSPDGSKIVSGSRDGTGRVWSATTGELLLVLRGHTNDVYSVVFSYDGLKIISGSADCTVRLWDTDTGASLLPPLHHDTVIYSIAISPDGSKIALGSHDQVTWLWDTASRTPLLRPTECRNNCILSVAFSPDGSQIVSGSDDNTVRLWDAAAGTSLLEPLRGHHDEVRSVSFVSDGSKVVSGSSDKTIQVWESATGTPLSDHLRGHNRAITSVAVSRDGSRMVSGSLDGALRVWDVAASIPEPLLGHNSTINAIAFSPDGSTVASGSTDNSVRVWDAITGSSRFGPIQGHDDEVTSVTFSPDGSRIISGSSDTTIRVWSATTGESLHDPLMGHTDAVTCTLISRDGSKIISASKDRTIRRWDTVTGAMTPPSFIGHNDAVLSIAGSPDSSKFVSGSADWTIRVWEAGTGKLILGPLQGHEGPVTVVIFSPDGSKIVSGSDDKTIRVWDSAIGSLVSLPLQGHIASITSVAFSPDSPYLISTSCDRTVRLWALRAVDVCDRSSISLDVQAPRPYHNDWDPIVIPSPHELRTVSVHDQSSVSLDVQAPRPYHNDWVPIVIPFPHELRTVSVHNRSSVSLDVQAPRPYHNDGDPIVLPFPHELRTVSVHNQSSVSLDVQAPRPYQNDWDSNVLHPREPRAVSVSNRSSVSLEMQAPQPYHNYPDIYVSPPETSEPSDQKYTFVRNDSKTVTKFPQHFAPMSVCAVEQAIYVSARSNFGELVIIDISTLFQ